MDTKFIVGRWLIIVSANSLAPLYILEFKVSSGIIFGILTWILVYIAADRCLIRKGLKKLSNQLFFSACIRALLQVIIAIDILMGTAALYTVSILFGSFNLSSNMHDYLTTIFTGLYLSFLCIGILLVIRLCCKRL